MLLKVKENRAWKRLRWLFHQLQAVPLLLLSRNRQSGLIYHGSSQTSTWEVIHEVYKSIFTTDSSRNWSKLSRISLTLATDGVSDSSGVSCFSPSTLNQSLICNEKKHSHFIQYHNRLIKKTEAQIAVLRFEQLTFTCCVCSSNMRTSSRLSNRFWDLFESITSLWTSSSTWLYSAFNVSKASLNEQRKQHRDRSLYECPCYDPSY